MKKTILLLVLAAIHVTVLAQHSLQLYDELSNEESHQFIATDHILLSSGFKSEPKMDVMSISTLIPMMPHHQT